MTQLPHPQPLLRIRGLSVALPDPVAGTVERVVEGLELAIAPGETVALLGESGAGKSMTASALLRLLPDGAVTEGHIELAGRELTGLSEREMQRVRGREIGLVFQDPGAALNPMYSAGWHVTEAVALGRGLGGAAAKDVARDVLAKVGFPLNRFDAYPHELSGGMRQRVMIATALAGGPKLLIADEPTTALDVIAAAQLRALLAELQRDENLALLVISHDLPMIAELADRVLVMYAGQIVESGATRDVLGAPQHPYTRALLECLPPMVSRSRGERRGRLNVIPNADVAPGAGCRFAPRCRDALDRCSHEPPPMRRVQDRESRCFLSPDSGGEA